ncbi:MAG: Mut7-C ubiquitin/RNAse domain-containing protein [Oligoflexia bacterium]|nr:Mut7-C ubiquitin/RNAse domain-containing protein [Oligoflexia bacterium]
MITITMRFYEELNYFLPKEKRKTDFNILFAQPHTVKDLIETLGVPRTEIDLILVNGTPVNFSYLLTNDARVTVYPLFEALNIKDIKKHQIPPPLRQIKQKKFILEQNLMDLTKLLRICGLDSLCDKKLSADDIVDRALKEERIILSKSVNLLKRKKITHAIFLRGNGPITLLKEVFVRMDLYGDPSIKPFTRCLNCNESLLNMNLLTMKENELIHVIPPKIKDHYHSYTFCKICQKLYWPGSHVEHMMRVLQKNQII